MLIRRFQGLAALACLIFAAPAVAEPIIIWDGDSYPGYNRRDKRPPEYVRAVAYSPDGKTLVSAGMTGFHLFDVKTGQRIAGFGEVQGAGAAFSPDGKQLFTADLSGQVLKWDLASRRVIFRFPKVHATIERLTLSQDGTTLATTDGKSTAFWNAQTGRLRHGWGNSAIPDPQSPYYRHRYIYSSLSQDIIDRDRESAKLPNRAHLALSPDGQWCAAHLEEAALSVKSTAPTERVRHQWLKNALAGLDFAPDGKHYALAYRNGDLAIVSAGSLQRVASFAGPVGDCMVRFAPDGNTVLAHHPEIGVLAAYDWRRSRLLWQQRQSPAWRSTALDFAPDGKHFATGDSDHKVRTYEIATGKLTATLKFPSQPEMLAENKSSVRPAWSDEALPSGVRMRLGASQFWHTAPLQAGCFLDNGKKILLFPINDEPPPIYDTATGKLVGRLEAFQKEQSYRKQVHLLPDHRHLLMVHDEFLTWWDLQKNRVAKSYRFPTRLSALGVTKDGKRIAVAGTAEPYCPQPIHVWTEGVPGMQALEGHDYTITQLDFSPDGSRLFSTNPMHQIYVGNRHENLPGQILEWDLAASKMVRKYNHAADQFVLAPDGNTWMFVRSTHACELFDWNAQKVRAQTSVVANDQRVLAVFTPDGSAVALGGGERHVSLWNARTGKLIRNFDGLLEQGTAPMCFSDDGKILATKEFNQRNDAGSVRLWNVETGRELHANPNHRGPVHHVAYSPDGRYIVSAGEDRRVLWWDAKTGALLPESKSALHELAILHLSFSANGQRCLAASMKEAHVWDVSRREAIARIQLELKHSTPIAFALNADGSEMRNVNMHGTVEVWNVATGKRLSETNVERNLAGVEQHTNLTKAAFSPDGSLLALQRNQEPEILVWNVAGRKFTRGYLVAPPSELETRRYYMCGSLVFSRDGRYLAASVSQQQYWGKRSYYSYRPKSSIQVWEIAGGQKAVTVGDVAATASLAFSPDGRTLLHGMQQSLIGTIDYLEYHSGYALGSQNTSVFRDLSTGAELGHFSGTGPEHVCLKTGMALPALPALPRPPQLSSSVAFAPDGSAMATIESDRTLLVWDAKPFRPAAPTSEPLDDDEFDEIWHKLEQTDSAAAHGALWRLTRDSTAAVAFLRSRLAPPSVPDPARVDQLLKRLKSDHFAARAQASAELLRHGELVEPALREALQRETSREAKRRIEELLERMTDEYIPARLQAKRGVEVLEKIDEADAGALLRELARGPALAHITQDARTALERWQRRRP